MLDDIKADQTHGNKSFEYWIEYIGETEFVEPTFKQNMIMKYNYLFRSV